MTNVQENPGAQRTRRNIMKTGAILASAAVATTSRPQDAERQVTGTRTTANVY